MKTLTEMVFPIEGYTDKIHAALEQGFASRPWLTYTKSQMVADLERTLPWTRGRSEHQESVFNKVFTTGLRRLIQLGKVKKVVCKLTTEPTFQWTEGINVKVYKNITGSSAVAKDPSQIGNRSLNARQIFEINTQKA